MIAPATPRATFTGNARLHASNAEARVVSALQGYAHCRSADGTFADDALAGAPWHSLCADLGDLGRVNRGVDAKDPGA